MFHLFRNRHRIVLCTTVLTALGLSACSTMTSIESGDQLADAAPGEPVVFGKFRLVRNGNEANLGTGPFANRAMLHMVNGKDSREIVGQVGDDGEFAWTLAPGRYSLTAIDFDSRGERETADTNFTFTVPADRKAVYIGSITLEATFESGYYGLNGTVDDYRVTNDCAADCEGRLAKLGLSMNDMAVELLTEQYHLARTD